MRRLGGRRLLFAVAMGAVGVALGVFVSTHPQEAVAIAAVPPIVIAACVAGRTAGLIATAVAAAGFALMYPHELLRDVFLIINGVLVSWLSETLLRTRERADRTEAAAFHANPLASVILRVSDHRFVAVNDAFTRVFGYTADELVGRRSDEVPFYTDSSTRGSAFREAAERGEVPEREVQVVAKDGRVLDVLASGQLVDVAGEPCLIGAYHDITERKRAEAALRESENRFRELAETIQEVFWIASPEVDRLHYVSPAYEHVFGRSCESLLARPRQWLESIVPEDQARVIATVRQHHGQPFRDEYRIRRPDGSTRWILYRGFPVHDESGRVVRVVGVANDVTDRRDLEDQLRQTQKMESLGLLAGGVAHDFNNILAVIASCTSMLGDVIEPSHADRELVDEIDTAVQRAAGLTRQLLAFSRKQVAEPRVVDVNAAVNETRKMLRRMVGEDVLLTTSLEPELRSVRIDPGNLAQVLMNLAVNARDAMPRGGTLSIVTRDVTLTDEQVRTHAGVRPGHAVLLEVSDTGAGMTPDVIAHIFEPFYTTKPNGSGTGMGLAVVHGIVEQAGGFITVESTPGSGTTFRIYLPVSDGAVIPHEQLSSALAIGTETILFVDDDEYVRRVGARALRARGYKVIEASDGASALAQLRLRADIDLLLTDVVMPGLDGRQLAEAARAQRPGLRVLYTSGYNDDAVMRRGVLHGEIEMIEKPFRIDTLATKVRHLLDTDVPLH